MNIKARSKSNLTRVSLIKIYFFVFSGRTQACRDSLSTAERLLNRHIPVVKNDRIIGMLSLIDLLHLSFVDSFSGIEPVDTAIYNILTIGQVMAKSPEKVSSDSTIKDIAVLLASKEFHVLPIVDNKLLVGIITTTDLLII